ncbi:hypothetical protein DFH07DRAFT_784001 [Mycena maculata]|uniref:Uncharacterized protein n=1 Tax=Mycena maculata TaxID=230809 RepID=A0AAD7MKJ2_9AGAR|nr:hypothetical protein DFH07DRAFT_784001 [Mycena maculata]
MPELIGSGTKNLLSRAIEHGFKLIITRRPLTTLAIIASLQHEGSGPVAGMIRELEVIRLNDAAAFAFGFFRSVDTDGIVVPSAPCRPHYSILAETRLGPHGTQLQPFNLGRRSPATQGQDGRMNGDEIRDRTQYGSRSTIVLHVHPAHNVDRIVNWVDLDPSHDGVQIPPTKPPARNCRGAEICNARSLRTPNLALVEWAVDNQQSPVVCLLRKKPSAASVYLWLDLYTVASESGFNLRVMPLDTQLDFVADERMTGTQSDAMTAMHGGFVLMITVATCVVPALAERLMINASCNRVPSAI